MSILNRRVARKSAAPVARSLTPAGRLSAAVDAAVSSRARTMFEGLETRTMFAAPTLTTITPFVGATEDTAYTISYAQLKAASDAADADGDAIKFRIEAISGGTLKKGTAAVSAGTLIGTGDTLTWTPAANANGTLNAFTVKASDGTNLSASAVQVQVNVDPVNDAPSITSVNTLTGATEDTPYTITYAALAAAAQGATDVDGDPVVFQFAAMSSAGKLTKNGLPVQAGDPIRAVLNPGESWVWTPATNASGTLNAFTIKTFDGQLASTTAAQVKVTVAAVNDAPTLSTVNTLTGASEDTGFSITYAQLVAASNIADVDGTAPMFKVEALSGGTLTKAGTPVTPGTTTLGTGETLVWTPASNVSGVLPAFTVSAWDGSIGSGTPVQVNVNVAAVNDAPVLTAIDTLTGGTEDSPYAISYEALVGATDVYDIDSTAIYFKIAAVSTGTLSIDDGVNAQAPVVPGTTVLKPGGVLYWVPAANANGSALNAFTVKANDGQADSTNSIQVKVDVAAVADAPTLTSVSTLAGATEDATYNITFANFLAAANEADADGDAVSFRIESVTSGTLTKGGVAVVPGQTIFTTGDTLVWTPDANANGTLNAFTVRATDGSYLSSTAVQVKVTAAAANDAPTLTNITTFANGTEDTAYTITYAQLLAASDAADVDGGNVLFRVEGVTTGTLKKGATAVAAGTTTIGPNEALTWTPAADANGILNAFTVKAYDGTAPSATAIQVKVGVAAVNDAPTLTGLANLTGATEDQTFNITLAKINAAAAGKVADVDSTTINYQITALGTGTLTLNGIPVAVGQVIDASTTLVWAPAANANGTGANALTAFSVKATDGALLSATAYPVKVDVANVNDAPTLSTINTLTGATEDTTYTITYAALNAASNANDIEGPVLFRIETVTAGTLTKGGVAVTPGTTNLGTGESLVWTPAANVNGSGVSAFTVKAYDGALASPSAVQVKVNVAAVNDAPTLTTISTLTGGTEDTAYPITYAALAAASNANDVDGTSPNFVITAVSSGTLTKNGTAVVPNTTQIAPGDTVVWTPAANANGSGASALSAFSVKVTDGLLTSATAVPVKVNVAAVNDAPVLTSFTNLTGANEDAPFTITYAQLKAASNVTDAENDTITFRIDAVSSGTLTKGGVPVVAGTTVIAAGDSVVWTPAANAYGSGVAGLPIMAVSAYDGNSYSAAPITVKADVANVNDAPTLTTITTFTTTDAATEDTPYVLTYAALAAAGDQADIDNSTILFRVEAVSSGTLKKNGSAVTAGTTTLGPGETLTWTPALNVNGTAVTAFTVKAYDGAAASTSAIPVKFDVTAVNDAPSLTSATTLTGATEDLGFTINFSDLVTDANDPEGDTVQYKIMAVSSGTLTKNGTPVVAGTDTFATGDSLVWTPDSDANGVLNAFTLIAGDGTDWSTATPVQVKVNVAAVNDGVPTYGSVTAISGATEDTPITITYAQLVSATGLTDLDPEQTLTFRIESVLAGTLTKNGIAVTASTTTLAAGESLVWTPAANANGAALSAFTVKGYDGVGLSATAATIKVDVAAVNDAPTLTSVTTLTGATEDTAFDIDFADLTTDANDADGDTITYRVESVVNGTLTKGGVAVTPGTTIFGAGDTLQWTPSADVNGTIGAFTLVASDGTLFSSTPITVNVTTAATSDDPTLTAIATFTKGIQNTPLVISYADLLAASDLKDADGGAVMFRIKTTDSGTLKKGGVTVTDGTTTLGVGESLTWTPAANASGSAIGAFTVEGWDGTNASTGAVAVLVDVAHVAQMPTLTTITTLTTNTAAETPTEDTAFNIDFAYFAAQTDAADPEGGTVSYRIESVGSGTLTKGGVAVVPGVTTFSTGDTLVWTPAANANGSGLTAFTVRASTTAGVSTTKVAIKVDVTAVNDVPTLTAISPLNLGASEDLPINITYAQLLAASDAREVDSGDTLSFRIEAVSSGTLTKGGVAVVPGTDTIGPGEVLVWTPDADANGVLNAFTVKAYDGTAASTTAIQVKMNVNAINDAPTLTAFTPITGASAGVAFNVTYSALTTAGDEADAEGGTINFVISKVLSGTLTKNGVAVIPGVTRIKAGDTLVWTSAANASGDTAAFSVFATDGQDLSATAVNVLINVA